MSFLWDQQYFVSNIFLMVLSPWFLQKNVPLWRVPRTYTDLWKACLSSVRLDGAHGGSFISIWLFKYWAKNDFQIKQCVVSILQREPNETHPSHFKRIQYKKYLQNPKIISFIIMFPFVTSKTNLKCLKKYYSSLVSQPLHLFKQP